MYNQILNPPVELDLNFQYLQAELERIDILIRREVYRWRLAGQDPADNFRGLYISGAEAESLLKQPPGTSWGQTITLGQGDELAFAAAHEQAVQRVNSLAEVFQNHNDLPRLKHLQIAFGLTDFDLDTFLICLAPSLDLRYERIYSFLQDDVTCKRPNVNLILNLLCEPGLQRLKRLAHFADNAPLFWHQLLERVSEPGGDKIPVLSQKLVPDPSVVAWLVGKYQPHTSLGPHTILLPPQIDNQDTMVAALMSPELVHAADLERPVFVFYGPDLSSQQAAANWLGAQLARFLLIVNLAPVIEQGLSPLNTVRLAFRDARLTGAMPCFVGWDACLDKGTTPPELLAEVCAYPDLVIVAGATHWRPEGIDRERALFWFEFPIPEYSQRMTLWSHYLSKSPNASKWLLGELDVSSLAGQFALTTGQIRDAVASARDSVVQRGESLQVSDLFLAARTHSSLGLANLARKISPRYNWQDIILPSDQLDMLQEIVSTVRGRPVVLGEWGVGKKLTSSNGVMVLFAGPPGTGKTMAAEVIASELALDLYKIDLSTIVSKYIGETEKNLEKIFREAETSNAILFFDEADAIFGKRSEVKDSHDRYANIEISYLLQRMEGYDGVSILATNLRANLDEAFTRRLQFAIDFPFPEEEYRLRIWQTLFPLGVPLAPEVDWTLMARYKLAGGNIRNIIVTAAFLAAADGGCVTMHHLLHGVRREMQKMGRLVNEKDLAYRRVG